MKVLDVNKNYRIRFEDQVYIDKNNETKAFDTLVTKGKVKDECYVVLNYIKVHDDQSALFERLCMEEDTGVEAFNGFHAYYFLKPQDLSNHYVVITFWEQAQHFETWVETDAYQQLFNEIIEADVIDRHLTYRIKFYEQLVG